VTKSEIKNTVTTKLNSGVSKTEIYNELSTLPIKQSQLASIVAACVPPIIANQHRNKIKVLIAISLLEVLIAFAFAVFAIYIGSSWLLFASLLGGSICLLFANGFHKNKLIFYNLSIFILLIEIHKQISGLFHPTAFTLSMFTLWLFMLVYTTYVRQLVFPDIPLLFPRKVEGKYVFSS
jgi:hypothetical protein